MKTANCFLAFLFIVPHLLFGQSIAPGVDIIGKGYDIFGEYASNRSLKRYPLFVFPNSQVRTNSFEYLLPDYLILENISDHKIKRVEGSSVNEYVENLSQNVNISGNGLFFKASVENHLGSSIESNQQSHFYTYMDANIKWRLSIDLRSIDRLKSIMDPIFKTDLNTMEPEKLFKTYGTHFVASAYLGGRADYSTTFESSSLTSEKESRTAIEARFRKISGGVELDEKSTNTLINCHAKSYLSVVGGNSEYANNISNQVQYDKWASGIVDRPVLCDFGPESLMPIWKLCEETSRKEALEKYYEANILPAHPRLPDIEQPTDIIAKYEVNLMNIYVIDDCENSFMAPGEFRYNFNVYVDGDLKWKTSGKQDVYEGQNWKILDGKVFEFHLNEKSEIKVEYHVWEYDEIGDGDDDFRKRSQTFKFPFKSFDLGNQEKDGLRYNSISLTEDYDCKAVLNFAIFPHLDPEATKIGNEGWKAYEAGDYEKCLELSNQALNIDNSLFYVHFNKALVHLRKGNPYANQMYSNVVKYCGSKQDVEGALADIQDLENEIGVNDQIKELKSMLRIRITQL